MGAPQLKKKKELNYRRGRTWAYCGQCNHYVPAVRGVLDGYPRCRVMGVQPGRARRVNYNNICDAYDNSKALARLGVNVEKKADAIEKKKGAAQEMRIGNKEREILRCLVPGEWIPPSIYLGEYKSCPARSGTPGAASLNRLVFQKKLAVFRYQAMTAEERKQVYGTLPPGRLSAERNAAIMPTALGVEVMKKLGMLEGI